MSNRRKVLLAVAPVGKAVEAPSRNPLTPEEVAAETIACAEAGASMVHLHVRDDRGNQTADLTHYSRTLDLIREKSDIVIQGSTGGLSSLTLEERCAALEDPRTQVASLNMGSTNFSDTVYINTVPDVKYWATRMADAGVVPELEIFTLGMFTTVDILVSEGLLPENPEERHYNFGLGFNGALPADMDTLGILRSRIPERIPFGVLNEGFTDFRFLAGAVAWGAAGIRVGFEDGAWLDRGVPAATNLELVEKAVKMLDILGCDPMTGSEAAEHMRVGKQAGNQPR